MNHRPAFICATAATVALSAMVLAACGGGGSATSTTPSTFALGRISGFGSIVVNGVHYDESHAIVKDEDGATHNQNELKLGMVVEVQAGEIGESNNRQNATAQDITFSSLIRGPIDSVGADSIVVLGQTVKVVAATVFDETLSGGLTALTAGTVVKVYGTFDSTTGVYSASRIEPQSGAGSYRLRGAVSAYDPVAKTLTIGRAVIDVSAVTIPDGLRAGSLVRVKLSTTRAVSGAWVAISVKNGLFEPQENDHTEVEGTITDFTSATVFSIDGLPVDASKVDPAPTGLAKGVRVEVEGTVVNGILVATKVKTKTDEQDAQQGFDVDGSITAADATMSTFVLRGVTVSFDAATVKFVGGTAADLTVGARVEVHGALANDGVTLVATRIEFKR